MEAAGVLPASGIVVHATTKSRSFYWPLRPAVHNNWVGQVKGICPGGKEDDKPTAGRKVRFREAGGMEARQASSDNTTSSESPSEGRVENNGKNLIIIKVSANVPRSFRLFTKNILFGDWQLRVDLTPNSYNFHCAQWIYFIRIPRIKVFMPLNYFYLLPTYMFAALKVPL